MTFVKAFAIIWIFTYHFFNFKVLMLPFGEDFAMSVIDVFFVKASGPVDYLKGASILMFLHGHLGVELFFIASGFGLYLSRLNSPASWMRFYLRRARRVVPLYWLALLVYYASGISGSISFKSLVQSMFFIQIYTSHPLDFGPLWFVSAIVFLYLLFPVFVKAFERPLTLWGLVLLSLVLPVLSSRVLLSVGAPTSGINPCEFVMPFVAGMLFARSLYRGAKLHRATLLSPAASAVSLLVFAALIAMSSYHLLPNAFEGDNFKSLAMLIGLGAPFLLITKLRAGRATRLVACGSYVTFLFHVPWIFLVANICFRYNIVHYTLTESGAVYFDSVPGFVLMGIFALCSLLPISFFVQWAYDLISERQWSYLKVS